MKTLSLLIIEFAATAHFMMSIVLFVFSRRSVVFLPQAWIMLIFALMYGIATGYFAGRSQLPEAGMLHPVMLLYLLQKQRADTDFLSDPICM